MQILLQVDDKVFAGSPGRGGNGAVGPATKRGLLDNYDDAEGYYNFQVDLAGDPGCGRVCTNLRLSVLPDWHLAQWT